MNAVDSAEGPEIQNDDFASQAGQSHRRGIDPEQVVRKLRRAHGSRVHSHGRVTLTRTVWVFAAPN